jgi:hypothetical protein
MSSELYHELCPPDPLAIVMGIEEKFGITIPHRDAQRILTMGQLYDYVRARVVRGQPQVCITSTIFYRLRGALMDVCGLPRERVLPAARVEDLVPLEDRARYWRALRDRLGNRHLPELRRPKWLRNRINELSMAPLALAVLSVIVLLTLFRDTPAAAVVGVLSVIACPLIGIAGMFWVAAICYDRTQHYAVEIPTTCGTVRDLVYALVSSEVTPIVSDTTRATDKEIWRTLCSIVGDELGREPASFTRDTKFT